MTLSRLASGLAVLAVLAVLGTTVTAVAAYTHRDDAGPVAAAPAGPRPGHAFAGGRFLRGGGARVEVPAPADGWTRKGGDVVVYYVDRRGDPAVGVRGPAVFRDGYCARRPGGSNRGFVGFARPATGVSVRAANTALGRRWVRAVALDGDLRTSSPHTPLRTRPLTLADGTPAVRSTSRIRVADRRPCGAPEVVVTLVSVETGGRVATVVMVRDAGVHGALSNGLADRILGTLTRR